MAAAAWASSHGWLMSERGARMAALDVNEEGLAQTAQGHERITAYRVDVSDFAEVDATARRIEDTLGPIHRVYNAAAIMPFGKALEHANAQVHRVMAINYGGLVNIAQATLPAMVRRGSGDFISFSSMSGIIPTLLTSAYNASKFAVSAYTEVLYHENRSSGVRFVCVCPPPVATPLLKQGYATVMPKTVEMMPPIQPVERSTRSRRRWRRASSGFFRQADSYRVYHASPVSESGVEQLSQDRGL